MPRCTTMRWVHNFPTNVLALGVDRPHSKTSAEGGDGGWSHETFSASIADALCALYPEVAHRRVAPTQAPNSWCHKLLDTSDDTMSV